MEGNFEKPPSVPSESSSSLNKPDEYWEGAYEAYKEEQGSPEVPTDKLISTPLPQEIYNPSLEGNPLLEMKISPKVIASVSAEVQAAIKAGKAQPDFRDDGLVDALRKESVADSFREVRRRLVQGETLGSLLKEISDTTKTGKDRGVLAEGVSTFAQSLVVLIMSKSKEGEQNPQKVPSRLRPLLDLSESIIVKIEWMKEKEGIFDDRDDTPKEMTSEQSSPASKNEMIRRNEVIVNNVESKSESRSDEGTEPLGESLAKRAQPYKLAFERKNGDVQHDELVTNRRQTLNDFFNPNTTDRQTQQMTWAGARRVLELLKSEKVGSVLLQQKMDPFTYNRAQEIAQRLEQGASFPDIVQNITSVADAKALRLLGMSFLEYGYGEARNKNFAQLPERNQVLVRAGEIIGLEAERYLIEKMVQSGKLGKEKALAAQKRYFQLANSDDIPAAFQKRFANVEQKLREKFGLEQVHIRQSEKTREATPETKVKPESGKRYEQPHDVQEEIVPQPELQPHEVQHAVSEYLKNSQGDGLREKDLKAVTAFMNTWENQKDYAEYITSPKRWYEHVAVGVEKFVRRPWLYASVFGVKGLMKRAVPYWGWRSAKTEMNNVRATLFEIFQRIDYTTGDKRFRELAQLMVNANKADPAQSNTRGQRIFDAYNKEEQLKNKSDTKPNVEDDFLRTVYPTQESLTNPSIHSEINFEDQHESPRDIIAEVERWQIENNQEYGVWAASVDDATFAEFNAKAQSRKMRTKDFWNAINQRRGNKKAA